MEHSVLSGGKMERKRNTDVCEANEERHYEDDSVDILTIFTARKRKIECDRLQSRPSANSVQDTSLSGLKPILVGHHDGKYRKLSRGAIGRPAASKKVRFDSTVEVNDAIAYSRQTIPRTVKPEAASGAATESHRAAPLCRITELESFEREIDDLSVEAEQPSNEESKQDDVFGINNDEGRLAGVQNENEYTNDIISQTDKETLSNQSLSVPSRLTSSNVLKPLASDPTQSDLDRPVEVLPTVEGQLKRGRVLQSPDDSTVECPERIQSTGPPVGGLILAPVSGSVLSTSDAPLGADYDEEGGTRTVRRAIQNCKPTESWILERGCCADEHESSANTGNDKRSEADISANDFLSESSRLPMQADPEQCKSSSGVAEPPALGQHSTGSGSLYGERQPVLLLYSSVSEPNNITQDLDPDGEFSPDTHQRSLSLTLQDGGDKSSDQRSLGGRNISHASRCSVSTGSSQDIRKDKQCSGPAVAGNRSGLEFDRRVDRTNRDQPERLENDAAVRKAVHNTDVSDTKVGQNAVRPVDRHKLSDETRFAGITTINHSRLQPSNTSCRPVNKDFKPTQKTERNCTKRGLDSLNIEKQWHKETMDSETGRTEGVVKSSDGDDVDASRTANEERSESKGSEGSILNEGQAAGQSEEASDPGDNLAPAVSGLVSSAEHTDKSGSEKCHRNESEATNTKTIWEAKYDINIIISEEGSGTNLDTCSVEEGETGIISSDIQERLAPLACHDDESDELSFSTDDQEMASANDQRVPGSPDDKVDDESDLEQSCVENQEHEERHDSFAETDFTEDSEMTFVVNTDVDDDLPDPFVKDVTTSRHTAGQPRVVRQDESIVDKLKAVSHSSILPGKTSMKSMLEQRAMLKAAQQQSLPPTYEEQTGKESENDGETKSALDGDPKVRTSVITMEITTGDVNDKQDVEGTDPKDKISSGSSFPDAADECSDEEVDMSTIKRKRARSEEKTSSSHGVFAESALSQRDVEEAMKKLKKSSEEGLRLRQDDQPTPANRRRYDWNTHHFFPDIHDVDNKNALVRRRSHDVIYSQYIEEDWLKNCDLNSADTPMETTEEKDKKIADDVQTETRSEVSTESDESTVSSSCDGDDSPKVWRKNPLLVRKKKKSERRLSAELHHSTTVSDLDAETCIKSGYESPSVRRKTDSPRSRRSPRRHSSPNRNKVQRKGSDLIQEKVERFQELQRRRKALESTSEECLALPKRQGSKPGHQQSDLSLGVKLYDLRARSRSQEDIHYESREHMVSVFSDLSFKTKNTKMLESAPSLDRTQPPPPSGPRKSQYDFLSIEARDTQSVQQTEAYTPEDIQRKELVDYKNVSSSFENIYDTVDLSVDSPSMDMDVSQYFKQNLVGTRKAYMEQQTDTSAKTSQRPIQVNIDVRQLPARVCIDHSDTTVASMAIKPNTQDDMINSRTSVSGSQPWQPPPVSSQLTTNTSPVWYVPKPKQQYDIPTIAPEKKQKKLDAKSLIEEEKKKFEDYKREYVRRLSERDSNSGASGDEQRRDAEPKHRVIPPDDYEYILRKIHHKRQDAYYAESTSQYQDPPSKSEAEKLKYSILRKKQQQPQQQPQVQQPSQQPHAQQQTSPLSVTAQSHATGSSPTKLYLDSLNLPSVHERSTSQLSTESSRELEQYFVLGKQKHANISHSLSPNDGQSNFSQEFNQVKQSSKPAAEPNVSVPGIIPSKQLGRSVMVTIDDSQLAEPDVIREGSTRTLLSEINQENEQWLSFQNRARSTEQTKPDNNAVDMSCVEGDRMIQYYPSKPPVPKQEDLPTNEPSQWKYNTTYSADRPPSHSPAAGSPTVQEQGQPSAQREMYGLVLRVTPQGAIASSPDNGTQVSLPIRTEPVWTSMESTKHPRPLSSSFLDYNPERKVYESEQLQDERLRGQSVAGKLGLYPHQAKLARGRHSQEDFQQLKDGMQYKERHAAPYRGHSLGRDRPGPSKTPPPLTGQYSQPRSPPTEWDPKQIWSNYQPEKYRRQHTTETVQQIPSQVSPKPVVSSWAGVPRTALTREFPADQPKDRSGSPRKSWSMRINEVESMRPPLNSDQPSDQPELTRSFAIVAVSDKNREKVAGQKVPFKSSEDRVQQEPSQPPPRELPQPSIASSQYEEHVKRSQERYRAQKHASVESSSSDQVALPVHVKKTDYVDPTFIRQRKVSTDSNQSSSVQNLPSEGLYKESRGGAFAADNKRSYGLQIQVENADPAKQSSEICLKLSRSKEDLTDNKPNVSIDSIKDRLFGSGGDKSSEASFKEELEKVWERHDRKVSAIQSEVFNSKEGVLPRYRSYSTSSAPGLEEDNDQRLLYYVSYKDGQARKRSNIYDVLTDLERTYEQLGLDDENLLAGAERREYISNVLSRSSSGTKPDKNQQDFVPEHTETNVKRLSITNLKKLEDLQKEQDSNPSLEYAKRWLEEDKGRAITGKQSDMVIVSSPVAPPPAPSESDASAKLTSLPRKIKDDMAFRRQNRPTGSTSSHQDFPVGSYLTKSPSVSPSQSVESLGKRSCRSRTPDPARDDLMVRNMQRAKSPGITETDPTVLALRSPTSTDYLNERTTEPARGRMRLRPERQADKYHDDLAYRKLRKDVPPVVAELPEAYYVMRGVDSRLRIRSQSLERVSGERKSRETARAGQALERCQSLGPTQRTPLERRPSLSKGISHMVEFFSQPITHTQSAPDLTERSIFAENYNEQGDLVSDDPRYAKYAQKPKKQQTPRTVKLRHEMKSKMRQLKHSADSGYMEQSESDASHSSSGPENRSPPDGNFDSDEPELRLSDTSSDKEANKEASRSAARTQSMTGQYNKATYQQAMLSTALSEIKFIDEGSEQNGNNNNNNNNNDSRFVSQEVIVPPTKDLPCHTFVLSLPDNKSNEPQKHLGVSDRQWPGEVSVEPKQAKYQPQFFPPRQTMGGQQMTEKQSEIAFRQGRTVPYQQDKSYSDGFLAYPRQTPQTQIPEQKVAPYRQQTSSKPVRAQDEQQRPSFLQDIPAAASQFRTKRQMAEAKESKENQRSKAISQAYYRPQQNDGGFTQNTQQQSEPKLISRQQQHQQLLAAVPHQHQQQTQHYQQHQQLTHHYQQPQHLDSQAMASRVQQEQQQRKQQPNQKARLDPYYPQLYQPIPQQEIKTYRAKEQYDIERVREEPREPPHVHLPETKFESKEDDHIRPGDRSKGKHPKPLPPTRVSSLIHEPYTEGQSQPQIPGHGAQKGQQGVAFGDKPESLVTDQQPWQAPVLRAGKQRAEIVQPATIETRSSQDMERHIKETDRRSWHEQMEARDDSKQVKLEFAFKAPEGAQFTSDVALDRQMDKVGLIPVSATETKPSYAPERILQQQQQLPHLGSREGRDNRTEKRSAYTFVAPPPTSSSQPESIQHEGKPSLGQKTGLSGSSNQARYELPVIYSKPKNAAAVAAASAVCEPQKPSYTVGPIIKTSPKKVEVKQTYDASADSAAVAKPVKDETETGKTKPVNTQQIQLRDVTRIIRDPTGRKPPSELRTTQIQVVTSKVLAPESEIGDTEQRTSDLATAKTFPFTFSSADNKQQMSKSPEAPVVVVTKFDKTQTRDRADTESRHPQRKQEMPVSKKEVTSKQERISKPGLPPSKHAAREPPKSLLLRPPSPSVLPSGERSASHSPSERGIILSPPPRRAGLDHFELSDGEMTDATDITLDGLVRSNLLRPSSPETIDFSDFADNISETGSDNSPQERKRSPFGFKMASGEPAVRQASSFSQQRIIQTSTSKVSIDDRTATSSETRTTEHVVRSEGGVTKAQDDDDSEQNLSFRDLIKSFEAKTNPFRHSAADSPQRSSSTDELQREANVSEARRPEQTKRNLKQISGSDPNLSKPAAGKGPGWRRV